MTPSMNSEESPDTGIRCLWIARYIPFPMDGGAQVYSANLSQSLARAGAFIRFMGLGSAAAVPESAAGVEWLAVPGRKRSAAVAALSALPFAAAIDATKTYRLMLETELQESWDAIVLDGYGTGWALDRCIAYCRDRGTRRPVLVHVSHNNEEMLWASMGREARGSALKRLALRRNAAKVATLERRIVRAVDLLTTITDEDRSTLGAAVARGRSLSITPGYTGPIVSARRITAATPRRVIIVGSFQWVVKQENLMRFVEIADPIFEKQGIEMDVVGEIPKALLAALKARCRATCFHGFVADVAPYLDRARIGIVPESIGGGFKLKFLDYIFGRVPVATVSQAVAGLSEELQLAMLKNDGLAGLVSEIVSHIDRIDELNGMQERAFALGRAQFDWNVRGKRFLLAIGAIRERAADGHGLGNNPLGADLPDAGIALG
jgi:glycosyl transferase family 1/glycosyl transferase family 4